MGEEESTKMEVEGVAGTAAHPPPAETVKDLAKDKSAVPPPEEEEKPDDSKALATVDSELFFFPSSLSLSLSLSFSL